MIRQCNDGDFEALYAIINDDLPDHVDEQLNRVRELLKCGIEFTDLH